MPTNLATLRRAALHLPTVLLPQLLLPGCSGFGYLIASAIDGPDQTLMYPLEDLGNLKPASELTLYQVDGSILEATFAFRRATLDPRAGGHHPPVVRLRVLVKGHPIIILAEKVTLITRTGSGSARWFGLGVGAAVDVALVMYTIPF